PARTPASVQLPASWMPSARSSTWRSRRSARTRADVLPSPLQLVEPCGAHIRLMRQCLDRQAALLAYPAEGPAGELLDLHEVPMRYLAIAGMVGVWLASPAQAQTMPPPFEDTAQIVCVDRADS